MLLTPAIYLLRYYGQRSTLLNSAVAVDAKQLVPEVLQANNIYWTFEETFDGNPSEPSQGMLPKDFDYVVTHRTHYNTPDGFDSEGSFGEFPADHSYMCAGPPSQHTVSTTHRSNQENPDKTFFICKDHMMSSMGDVEGYSISAFYPTKEFNFSDGGAIAFDVNINQGHPRSWWEILITPRDQMKLGAAQEWLPVDETYPKDRIVLTLDKDSVREIQVGKDQVAPNGWYVGEKDWRKWSDIAPNDPALVDRTIRRTNLIEFTENQLKWSIQKQDGTYDTFSADIPGGLPFDNAVVMFKTHAYTPTKDGNDNVYTFHWDNVKVAGNIVQEWEVHEIGEVMKLREILYPPPVVTIGSTKTQTLELPYVGDNPILMGQVHGALVGQVLVSINGSPDIVVQPEDVVCSNGDASWSTFHFPLNPNMLKVGENTFAWKMGPRPSCATWEKNGFSIKDLEVQFNASSNPTPPPPPPPPDPDPIPTPDTTPPQITASSPSGELEAGTTSVQLSVTTNESAVCKYSFASDVDYAQMSGQFTTNNSLVHTAQISGLQNATSYNYYVKCADTSQNISATTTISFSVAAPVPPVPPPDTIPYNKFLEKFFNDQSLNNQVLTSEISAVNYNWGSASPNSSVLGADHFSASWTGNFNFEEKTYKFTTTADDGVRLYFDGNIIINEWHDHPATTYTKEIPVSAGVHEIKLEYYENFGLASVVLDWAPVVPPYTASNEFVGEYYAGKNFEQLRKVQVDDTIDFAWGKGSPFPQEIGKNNFSIKWQGDFDFQSGLYTFNIVSDDGVRLYVDGQLAYEDWQNHRVKAASVDLSLYEGVHEITLEYYEASGNATVSLDWVRYADLPAASLVFNDLLSN